MTHSEKIQWMMEWCVRNGAQLELKGEIGFGRECVGVTAEKQYPEYMWYDDEFNRLDTHGEDCDFGAPANAYHKGPYVAVLGRGEDAEAQLFDWLQWFDANGFKLQTGDVPYDSTIASLIARQKGVRHRAARMVKR